MEREVRANSQWLREFYFVSGHLSAVKTSRSQNQNQDLSSKQEDPGAHLHEHHYKKDEEHNRALIKKYNRELIPILIFVCRAH